MDSNLGLVTPLVVFVGGFVSVCMRFVRVDEVIVLSFLANVELVMLVFGPIEQCRSGAGLDGGGTDCGKCEDQSRDDGS